MNEPKLGQWYRVSHSLERLKQSDDRDWVCRSNNEKSMLIGVRTLSDGFVSDRGVYFPQRYFKAYMLVSDIREKPFFALPKHCEFMSNWESGGIE